MPTLRTLVPPLLLAFAGAASAAPEVSGRWEGEAQIPGAPLPIVLDLEVSPSGGGWRASLTLPGRRVKGAPLAELSVSDDGRVRADAAAAFGGFESTLPTRLDLQLAADGRLVGEWQQGGHRAATVLHRSGAAQVDRSPPATVPLPLSLAGTWRGRYELGGYPRDVTLSFAKPAPTLPPFGTLLIVGKRRSELLVERVVAGERYLTIEAGAGIRFEGRWDPDEGRFEGWMKQGPFEAPLQLRRIDRSGA